MRERPQKIRLIFLLPMTILLYESILQNKKDLNSHFKIKKSIFGALGVYICTEIQRSGFDGFH